MEWSRQAFDVVVNTRLTTPPERSLPVVASSVAAFGTTLAASTWTQKMVGLSTGSMRPIPSLAGVVSVCAAACISHKVALFVEESQSRRRRPIRSWGQFMSAWPKDTSNTVVTVGHFRVTTQMIRVCMVGMLTFRVLGGRFWAVAPSSYTHLGSYARGSLPATANYATPFQRGKIERMGRIFGCHTCGSRRLWQRIDTHQFVGDHMPPKSVADQMNRAVWRRMTGRKVSFRFYPQCVVCSSKQGSLLSAATQRMNNNSALRIKLANVGGGHQAHHHGWRPRISHLTGGVIAGAALIDPDLATIEKWSRQAGHRVQSFLHKTFYYKR
jgi:hypothetical protein